MNEYEQFKKYFSSLSDEEINKRNEKEYHEAAKQHELFVKGYRDNICYLCGGSFDIFEDSRVCSHWLLNPKGFTKRYFPQIYRYYSYVNIQTFLRWIANQERLYGNINDLVEEMNSNKIIDNTIVYKNLEWSFSCTQSDFQGHHDKFRGKEPHYHFQMRIDNKIFIKYAEFHIPFTKYDLLVLQSKMDKSSIIESRCLYGEGMHDLFTRIKPDNLVKYSTPTDDEKKATVHFQTIVEAEPGKKISSDDIYKIFQESKEKNVPISSLVHKLGAKSTIIIEPAPSVPEIAHRTKRRRG
jgi:hypothetical protein